MTHLKTEKLLGSEVSFELCERFDDYIASHNDAKRKQVVTVMVELWLSLPEDMQAMLLHAPAKSSNFVAIIQKIIEERIQKVLPSAQSVVSKADVAVRKLKVPKQNKGQIPAKSD